MRGAGRQYRMQGYPLAVVYSLACPEGRWRLGHAPATRPGNPPQLCSWPPQHMAPHPPLLAFLQHGNHECGWVTGVVLRGEGGGSHAGPMACRAIPDFSLPENIRRELGLRRSLASGLSWPLRGSFEREGLSLHVRRVLMRVSGTCDAGATLPHRPGVSRTTDVQKRTLLVQVFPCPLLWRHTTWGALSIS